MKKLDRQNRAGVAALSNQDLRSVAGGEAIKTEALVKAEQAVRNRESLFDK